MKFLEIDSEEEMLLLGKCIGERVKPGDLLFLSGDLGAGKTTLTKGIAAGLGINEPITSPTFQLKKSYRGRYTLNHLDLYRLNNQSELEVVEPDELVEAGIAIIEWGNLLLGKIHSDYLEIIIEFANQPSGRKLTLNAYGARYLGLIEELNEC